MSETEDAAKVLLRRKAELIIDGNEELDRHVRGLLEELSIDDPLQAAKLGAVDAMIFDVAKALGLNRLSSHAKRAELIREVWRKE